MSLVVDPSDAMSLVVDFTLLLLLNGAEEISNDTSDGEDGNCALEISKDDTSKETVGGGDGVDEIFKSKDVADKTGDGFEEISEGASDEVVEGKADSKIDKAKDSSDAEVIDYYKLSENYTYIF